MDVQTPGRVPVSPIQLARVYDRTPHPVGAVLLVERLWPRGVRKDSPCLGRVAARRHPQPGARDVVLPQPGAVGWQPLVDAARDDEVTRLNSSRHRAHNNAVALHDFLLSHPPTAEGTPDEQDVARGAHA
jgi:uncharacterized protein YeaO (DUF488 family)